MSPSGSSAPFAAPGFVVLGNPGGRRVALFQEALAQLGLPPARRVAWEDLLAGRASLFGAVCEGAVVRLESPGRDFEVERLLLSLGAELEDAPGYARLSRTEAEALAFERGRILWPRQWYLGFRAALARVRAQLAECPPHLLMNDPAEIEVMFDKRRCHARLAAAGVPVPRALGSVGSFEELSGRMRESRCSRVFLKLAHGSSASGVVAYRTNGRRHQAFTTVEIVRREGGLVLYNSRRIRTHEDPREIAEVVDALCPHGVHVEEWIPKAAVQGRSFDLRVVAVAGRPRQVCARLSRTPMTNLHLLNQRGDAQAVIARLGAGRWEAARRTCEATASCFPGSLHLGIDLLIASDFRAHAVLEVNAFGDLLPGILDRGEDTYTAEVRAAVGLATAC